MWNFTIPNSIIFIYILLLVNCQRIGSSDFIGSCCDAQHERLGVSPEPCRFAESLQTIVPQVASVLMILQSFAAVQHQAAFPLRTFTRKGFQHIFHHPKSGLEPSLRNSLVISQKYHQASNSGNVYQRESAAGSGGS